MKTTTRDDVTDWLAQSEMDWREGKTASAVFGVRNAGVMLRLDKRDGDNVETSNGYAVPLAFARKVWALVKRARNEHKAITEIVAAGRGINKQEWRVTAADNGDLIIGCTYVQFHEARVFAMDRHWPGFRL